MESDCLDNISHLQQNKEDWKSALYSSPLNKLVETKKVLKNLNSKLQGKLIPLYTVK